MKNFEVRYLLNGKIDPSLKKALDETAKGFGKVEKSVDTAAKSRSGLSSLRSELGGLIPHIAAGAAVMDSLNKAMNFESQISSIQAVTGFTVKQMGVVEEKALAMGRATKYSATEAAKGIEELVKAGMGIEDALDTGIENSLNLAAAGEIGLAEASETVATAMNAFKRQKIEAKTIVDDLAGAANASASSVQSLNQSLSQAQAVAAGTGLAWKGTIASLGVMSNAGLQGSDAGTSLKTMLLNLTPVTNDAMEEFDRLGLMTFDAAKAMAFLEKEGIKPATNATKDIVDAMMTYAAEIAGAKVGTDKANKEFNKLAFNSGAMSNSFYDSNGSLKDMSEIAGTLRDALKDLTDQQRQVALKTMFGTDAIRAANVLYEEGAEGIKDFYDEMSKTTAADVAKTRMDNTKGSIELFKSSLETLQITVMKSVSPALRQLADLATDITSNHGEAIATMVKVGLVAYPVIKVTRGIVTLTRAVGGLSVATKLLAGPIGWIVGGVGLVATGLFAMNRASKESRERLLNMGDAIKETVDNYKTVKDAAQTTRELTKEHDRLTAKLDAGTAPTEELTEARRKLEEVERRLIELNPDVLSAEDAKNGKLREQLGYVNELQKSREDLARLEMEKQYTETLASAPAFVGAYRDAKDDYAANIVERDKLRDTSETLVKYSTQLQTLAQRQRDGAISMEELERRSVSLRDELNQKLGTAYSNNSNIALDAIESTKQYEELTKSLVENKTEMLKIEQAVQAAYEQNKLMAEEQAGLNMTIEEASKAYSKLDANQKKALDEAIRKVRDFEDMLTGLPISKKVNIDVVYNDIGKQNPYKPKPLPHVPNYFDFGKEPYEFANGGFVNQPTNSITGEAGEEAIIPLTAGRRRRGLQLYQEVGRRLGVQQPMGFNVTMGDTRIEIQGSADDAAINRLKRELDDHKRTLLSAVEEQMRRRGRVNIGY